MLKLIVSLKLCKEYLNVSRYKISLLLQIKNWTFLYGPAFCVIIIYRKYKLLKSVFWPTMYIMVIVFVFFYHWSVVWWLLSVECVWMDFWWCVHKYIEYFVKLISTRANDVWYLRLLCWWYCCGYCAFHGYLLKVYFSHFMETILNHVLLIYTGWTILAYC